MDTENGRNEMWGVWDLDGVLCDDTLRVPLARLGNWNLYHSQCLNDPAREAELHLLFCWSLYRDNRVGIITARPEIFRKETEEWLKKNGVAWDDLHMRPDGNHEPSRDVKKRILDEAYADRHVLFIFEDNPRTIELLRKEGYTVFETQKERR